MAPDLCDAELDLAILSDWVGRARAFLSTSTDESPRHLAHFLQVGSPYEEDSPEDSEVSSWTGKRQVNV